MDRRRPAQDLVGRGAAQRRVGEQPRTSLGSLEQRDQAEATVCRVVSLPAVVSSRKNTSNSRSVSREPSTSASTAVVVMSSRGSARRAARQAVAVGDQLERGRARERQLRVLARSSLAVVHRVLAHQLGVGVAEQPVAELDQQAAVLDRERP